MLRRRKRPTTFPLCQKVGDPFPLGTVRRTSIKTMWVGFNYAFSRQAWSFRSAQVPAHEARPRIGLPRQQGQAGDIG